MKNTIIFLACLLSLGMAQASELGGYAGAGFRITADAVSAGSGGIVLFPEASSMSLTHNAASMTSLEGRQFSANLVQLPLDRHVYSSAVSLPLPPTARLGVAVISAGTRKIPARDNRGFYAGDMSDTEMAYLAAFSNRLSPKLSIGLSLKVLSRRFDTDAFDLDLRGTGFGMNMGADLQLSQRTRLSLALRDWNASYNWKTQELFDQGASYRESFPANLAWGILHKLGSFQVMLEHDQYFVGEHVFKAAVVWQGLGSLLVRGGAEVTPEGILPGFSSSYTLNWKGPPMALDLGLVSGIPGEGIRTYLGWRLIF